MRRLLVFFFCCSLAFAQKPPKLPSINDAIPKVSMHIAPITTVPEQSIWDRIFHREEEGQIFIPFPAEWHLACKEPPVWAEDLQVRDQRDAHVKIISVTKLGVTLIAPRGHDIAVRMSC